MIIPGVAPDVIQDLVDKNEQLKTWIFSQNTKTKITGSVCTGSLYLADIGLLDGHAATTHPACIAAMKEIVDVEVREDVRFVMDQKYITGSGITSGIDVALQILEIINGKTQADIIAKMMVYNRTPDINFIQK